MRHCHFHFFRKIRFSLCLSLFLIGLGIFCAAVCKCADSDTWIVQFLTNPQADSGKSSSDADAPDAASASDASSENTTALNAAFTDYVTELFRQEASANLLNLHYTLADPAAYGITDYQTSLGTCSADSPALAAAFAENLLAGLQQFQSAELSAENRLTLDILSESLDLTKNGANWYCYEEPLTPTTGLQSQIPILLAEYTFRNTRDITDYLSLLSDIPRYFSEISAYEKEKAAAGRFMPSFAAQRLIQQCKDFTADLNSHYLVATFNEKTDAMSELSKNERAAYQNQNRDILEQQVFPAFEQLSNTIAGLQNSGYNDAGLCHFPEGNTYYEYLVHCYTGSDDSVATLEKRTASQRKKDLLLVSELLEDHPDLTEEPERLDFSAQSPEEMLAMLQQAITADFPSLPDCNVTVKYINAAMEDYLSPAFYLTSPLDQLTENTIYINQKNGYEGIRLFTTLAHEGFPGHLYQNLYFHSQDVPPIRSLLGYPGYTEGWATFVELHSYIYSGLSKDAAKLCAANQAAILSLYATADMGIHYEGWTLDDTAAFFSTYGFTDEEVLRDIFELIVSEPANYLKYYIGYLEFHDLQEEMKKQNPDTYTDSAFYEKVLKIGPASFNVLRDYVLENR